MLKNAALIREVKMRGSVNTRTEALGLMMEMKTSDVVDKRNVEKYENLVKNGNTMLSS